VTKVSLESVLGILPKPRLIELGRHFGVGLSNAGTREALVSSLQASEQVRFAELVEWMGRDELRRACEKHGLSASERARPVLAARLIGASGIGKSVPPVGLFGARPFDRHAPRVGDIVQVRQRQYLVEEVTPPPDPADATLVDLVCLDDDNQGRPLQVLWELELGAQVKHPDVEGLGEITKLDPPRHFAAYLHALRWNSVTATDTRLFQSPFRAGIKLLNHQLIPLKKALELPRANLFIADDVGLGKTIEAGLVLQELELRQRVDFVLIVCPASICLQWRREMEKRFGQRFEIYDREFMAQRRRERGFGVQAWGTHNRFIISYQTLRRPEYFEPLIQHLGNRLKKSLLVLDEAHTAAPASSSKYAIDSRVTGVVRDLAPRFENRLFLSATPHNGHSNSFSALMEILDPQRFTRGVPVHADSGALKQVMVRRLKRDLRSANMGTFPLRRVIPIQLTEGPREELKLATMLAEYTKLMRPKKGRGQLVFINLQKRLLSCVDAFYRTLQAHAERVEAGDIGKDAQLDLSEDASIPLLSRSNDESTYDADEDALDREEDQTVRSATQQLQSPSAQARKLLSDMLALANRLRREPDAKALALIDWIQKHQCAAASPGGAKGKDLKWQPRRLLIFTEYADTKRYLTDLLQTAVEGTHLDEERIAGFHGAMSDEQREQVQRHFNGDPDQYPVRILIATDAAREGLNLQNHCADLFHFDIPWNPARMEQRNGRIDRTLQPSPEVRCHYFVYPDRPEDAVLEKLVKKVDTIQEELGSLGDVVMQRIERSLAKGIDQGSLKDLDAANPSDAARSAVQTELEAERADIKALYAETEDAAKILNASQKLIDFEPERLHDAVNVGLELAGAGPLRPIKVADIQDQQVYELPSLGESWVQTLDTLRPPRERGEEPWDWRKKPPQPVVFKPLERMGEERVHLHLEHPFVQRILSRFRAQGYSAQDLSRVTVVPNPHDAIVRVIAFGRVSLFGPGAARLHDELVSVAAQWLESKGKGHLRPFADAADREAIKTLESLFEDAAKGTAKTTVPDNIQARLRESAAADFSTLWGAVKDEAEDRAHRATQKLTERGHAEAEALRRILTAQRETIKKTLSAQLSLFGDLSADEQKQWQNDKEHMAARLTAIDKEIKTEPADIEALYRVSLQRLEPVGLVYLWPTTRM
jgi:superfamily II DNA or RNA helicase